MPNNTQQEVLESFIGAKGIYYETILEYDGVDMGTKVHYLERAIGEDCQTFLESLDKLYQPDLRDEAQAANIDLIRALKVINDLCFNNDVRYGGFGNRAALSHYFGSFGKVDADDFQGAIREIINDRVTELREANEDEITQQIDARKASEGNIVKQRGWRTALDLPLVQRVATQPTYIRILQQIDNPQQILHALHQRAALNRLELYGLTIEHLQGKEWFDSRGHVDALENLMVDRNMSADDAMAEIDQLTMMQAYGIAKGLTRQETLALSHYSQRNALAKLKDHGLTHQHLQGKEWFDSHHHVDALENLMVDRNMSANDAMAEIDGLNSQQSSAIYRGLTRQETLVPVDPHAIEALGLLKDKGLTLQHLQGKEWFSNRYHVKALEKLMVDRNMSADDAMAEIDQLTTEQAHGIAKGLTRQETLALDNFNHKRALARLKSHGLTLQHLQGKEWFNSYSHQNALENLIVDRNMSADDAMAEIDQLTEWQAKGIYDNGLTRQETVVLNNTNQRYALEQLKSRGLTHQHLQGKEWFYSSKHVDALENLMVDRNMSADDAMAEIDELTEGQAEGISGGLTRQEVLDQIPRIGM